MAGRRRSLRAAFAAVTLVGEFQPLNTSPQIASLPGSPANADSPPTLRRPR